MKTKLLKTIRKRFTIIHLPDGFISGGTHYNFNLFKLIDNTRPSGIGNHYAQVKKENSNKNFNYNCGIFNSEEECINHLKNIMLISIREEYSYYSVINKKINNNQIKVWHVTK